MAAGFLFFLSATPLNRTVPSNMMTLRRLVFPVECEILFSLFFLLVSPLSLVLDMPAG